MASSLDLRRKASKMPSKAMEESKERYSDSRAALSRAFTPSPGPSRAHSIIGDSERPRPKRKIKHQPPQKSIDEFWNKFSTKSPGKAFTILPDNLYAKRAAAYAPKGVVPGENAISSYKEAVETCKAKVAKIVKECKRVNQKYRDPHFDIESDFAKTHPRWMRNEWLPSDCLMGLLDDRPRLFPQSVKRVEDIFAKPQFFIDEATANDVRQGKDGDCWFMSALSTLSNMRGLIEKVCVARDEKVGVYGFVFYRDGEWISVVIDDKLYLIKEDFNEATLERNQWLDISNRYDPEEEYRSVMQSGSRALYFAQCTDQNETWLPLLEKAYAKAHGDYNAIDGGFVGEGIEDLTGGVTTELFATDILDKDRFWKDELMRVNKDFLFGCGQMGGVTGHRRGIQERHAYSIMKAVEIDGERLLKLRNPWGNTEWRGPWSDGSAEWTPEWMQKLDHSFGDDGLFWISYKDLLKNYQHFDRTRLFNDEWSVTQRWTSLNIPWSVDYLDTKFRIRLRKAGQVVIVLSQLDDRYFLGLEGQYTFRLQFRLHAEGEDDYIVRSNGSYYMKRSVSTEVSLDPGTYIVLLKITATRKMTYPTPHDVIRETCRDRREKLLQIGLSYDLAHAKGGFRELEKERRLKSKQERRERQKAMLKKQHAERTKTHRKQKLKKLRMDMKKFEKAARRAQFDVEKAEQERGDGIGNGLGIDVNGDNAGPVFTNPYNFTGTNNTDSRPGTPKQKPSTINGRAASPGPMHQHSRSDTLPIRPASRRNTLSPVPNIYVRRPSVASARPSLSDISDDDLSWDSEIMGPETEPESDSDESLAHGHGYGGPGFGYDGFDKPDEESEDEFEADPWNAVVCIGLRVYSLDKDVQIEVINSNDIQSGDEPRAERTLDLDDSAKDATKKCDGGTQTSPLETRRPELSVNRARRDNTVQDAGVQSGAQEQNDNGETENDDEDEEESDVNGGGPANIEEDRQG